MNKVSVGVRCNVSVDGVVSPQRIVWGDGRVWEIERVLHTCRSSDRSFEGIRYTVLIGGKEKYLYYSEPEWYVYTSA